jgi:hypothetical protein
MAKDIAVPDLRQLAIKLHTLPPQEQERVRTFFRQERADVYQRIVNGLRRRIRNASQKKKLYFRFASYVNRKTGQPNMPHNMIHLLTASDAALIWEQLKESTGLDQPKDSPHNQHRNEPVAIHARVHSANLPTPQIGN